MAVGASRLDLAVIKLADGVAFKHQSGGAALIDENQHRRPPPSGFSSIHTLEEFAIGFLVERSRPLNLLSTFCPLH